MRPPRGFTGTWFAGKDAKPGFSTANQGDVWLQRAEGCGREPGCWNHRWREATAS